jgi:RNA polymerase-interacting CarD/CdnL/TRCF family regulator
MFSGMKIKTSVTLSEETLASLEELTREGLSKSRIVEIAVADLLDRHRRRRRDQGDREILDRRADVLNREVEDILGYQIEP